MNAASVSAVTSETVSANEEAPPPAALIAASVGLGKTQFAIENALRLVEQGVGSIVLAAPTHKLNQQLLARARAQASELGICATIEMFLGREAIDPNGDGAARMCMDLEAVREVQAAGLDVQSYVCRRKRSDETVACCVFFDRCPYQVQRAKKADIWLITHAALGHRKPPGIGSHKLLIVDENPVMAMLRGTAGGEIIGMGDLATVVLDRWGAISELETSLLHATAPALVSVRNRMSVMARCLGAGPATRRALLEAGITSNELRQAARQVMRQLVRPRIQPGISAEERSAQLKPALGNRVLLREAKMYRLLSDFLRDEGLGEKSGHVRLERETDTNRNVHEVWRLDYLAPVSKGWSAPTLLLDATARAGFRFATRKVFPGLRDDLGGEVMAAAPHLRIRLVRGRSMSLSALRKNLHRHALEVSAVTARELRRLKGTRALAVTNKVLADEIRVRGLPQGVEVAHYNALRGRNDWCEARLQISWGRPLPSPVEVETIAGAITGSAVEPVTGWYPMTDRPLIVDGKVMDWQRVPYHPNPHAEAVRWQICEGEILQSERLRSVNRSSDSPADWLLIGCPVPENLELATVEDYAPPGPIDLMLAAGGVALLSAPAAAKAYPDIFPNAKAAKNALGRGGPRSNIRSLIEEMRLSSAQYRLPGAGRRPAIALFDVAAVPDLKAWLEARLGPLAEFSILADVALKPIVVD